MFQKLYDDIALYLNGACVIKVRGEASFSAKSMPILPGVLESSM